MARRSADLKLSITIEFDDDGKRKLADQAIEAALFELGIQTGKNGDAFVNEAKVVGRVKEIEEVE